MNDFYIFLIIFVLQLTSAILSVVVHKQVCKVTEENERLKEEIRKYKYKTYSLNTKDMNISRMEMRK